MNYIRLTNNFIHYFYSVDIPEEHIKLIANRHRTGNAV